ncbi:MAG: hypothetical protein C7B45_16445 [Sulfobacillus acidophilus]|uniref:Uncharacterized protein n=1 Tax=Sulfobacillus acidophilus TaxID=53633 RepID=A0A2T2WCZ1_9FIRM|nr:MAG: hypothetical protein C7B45_16445 [Sulfobacillus acidophilus]
MLRALERVVGAGFGPVKINVVVKRGMNDADIVPLAQHFRLVVTLPALSSIGTWAIPMVGPRKRLFQRGKF